MLMPRIAAVPLLRCVALLRSSVRSARRLVAQNRVYINGQRAQDEHAMVGNADTATWLLRPVFLDCIQTFEHRVTQQKLPQAHSHGPVVEGLSWRHD